MDEPMSALTEDTRPGTVAPRLSADVTDPVAVFCLPAVFRAGDGRVGAARTLSCQRSDAPDQAGFCSSAWAGAEEYSDRRTYAQVKKKRSPRAQRRRPAPPSRPLSNRSVWSVTKCCFACCRSNPGCTGRTVPSTGPRARRWTAGSRLGVT